MNDITKLATVIGEALGWMNANEPFATDLDSLIGTSSDGFARSVLGYVMAHGAPTARQIEAIHNTARRARPRAAAAARTAYVRSHGEASVDARPPVPSMTVERGLTRQVPCDLVPPVVEEAAHAAVLDAVRSTSALPKDRGAAIDALLDDFC